MRKREISRGFAVLAELAPSNYSVPWDILYGVRTSNYLSDVETAVCAAIVWVPRSCSYRLVPILIFQS